MTDEFQKGLITGLAMQPLQVTTEHAEPDPVAESGFIHGVIQPDGSVTGIIKKTYTVPESYDNYLDHVRAYFKTVHELVGGDWEYVDSTSYGGPSLRIETTNGYYGIVAPTSRTKPLNALIAGQTFTMSGTANDIMPPLVNNQALCVVWFGKDGSIGFGDDLRSTGIIMIRCIMAKFNEVDRYAIGAIVSPTDQRSLIGYAANSIAGANMTNVTIGSGVYMHALLDPYINATCSDVLGVRCFDKTDYGRLGTIVAQGDSSYMSVLGSHNNDRLDNVLFVKM